MRRAEARRRADAEAQEKALYYSLKASHRDRQLSEVSGEESLKGFSGMSSRQRAFR